MSKPRDILLIEPNYRNKYPPIGLMKISSYHRRLGDNVEFFKGEIHDLILDKLTIRCIADLKRISNRRDWKNLAGLIKKYIHRKQSADLTHLVFANSHNKGRLIRKLNSYSTIYRKKEYDKFPKWDRVYVTSLFTFYWKITTTAIELAQTLVREKEHLLVGGVLASLLNKELEDELGIKAHKGLLDVPGILDPNLPEASELVVDNMPLDYSILEETDYEYPTGSAYFTFMTKGCTRKCAFCSVPILEPTYKPKIDTIDKFAEIKAIYGEQQNLLLMDNNVLASPNFPEIIAEIKAMGFYKGATYIEPNQLEIAIRNLKAGLNDKAYIKRSQKLYVDLIKRLKGTNKEEYVAILKQYQIDSPGTAKKSSLIRAYKEVEATYERFRKKNPILRHVDFNQGTDARYVTEEIMQLLSEIPIKPLRIAFDYWTLKDKYEAAVRLAAKYGLKELSNYILYNFHDSPEELYRRLEINVKLNEELGTQIFSFPMKYIPLFGEEAKNRNFIGKKWNKKFIRAIQCILNVTKGIVAPGKSFFERAFGKTLEDFHEILFMPEEYIVYRQHYDDKGFSVAWREAYAVLNDDERKFAETIICANDFLDYQSKTDNPRILNLLQHYSFRKSRGKRLYLKDFQFQRTKNAANRLIKNNRSVNLTLTYDFEAESARKAHAAIVKAV